MEVWDGTGTENNICLIFSLAWRRFLTLLGAFCDRQNISGASKMRIKSQYSVWTDTLQGCRVMAHFVVPVVRCNFIFCIFHRFRSSAL